MSTPSSSPVNPLERMLIHLEDTPWAESYRIAIGFLILPAATFLAGVNPPIWALLFVLLGALVALRVGPAAARAVLPFSDDSREAWRKRRQLAKRSDAHQWRRLFWIGLGLVARAATSNGFTPSVVAFASACLLAGAAGTVMWHFSPVRTAGKH